MNFAFYLYIIFIDFLHDTKHQPLAIICIKNIKIELDVVFYLRVEFSRCSYRAMYNHAKYDIKRKTHAAAVQRREEHVFSAVHATSQNNFFWGIVVGAMLSATICVAAYTIAQRTVVLTPAPIEQKHSLYIPEKPVLTHPVTLPVAKKKVIVWPQNVDLTIHSGHSLVDILTSQNISQDEAYQIIESAKNKFNPKDLRIGQHIFMTLQHDTTRNEDTAATLSKLSVELNPLETLTIIKDKDNFNAATTKKQIKTIQARTEGTIDGHYDGIYKLAKKDQTPDPIINNLIKAFSYDVDFQRDIREGDHIEILYEKMVTEDNITVGSGKLLHATLTTKGKTIPLYFFSDGSSEGYFKDNGESIIKKLLRTPVDGARISSGFGMRQHPILGYSKMHKGLDFAAPSGTPIYAAGDGVINFAGVKGGYGNFVMVKHNADYITAYGHCSRIAKGITEGKAVKQGDIIAYVGSTGRSTGPHLHYEIIQKGTAVNPANVKFAGNNQLTGKRLASFKAFKQQVATKLAELAQKKEMQLAQRDKIMPPPFIPQKVSQEN